jgi:hypothetical protein
LWKLWFLIQAAAFMLIIMLRRGFCVKKIILDIKSSVVYSGYAMEGLQMTREQAELKAVETSKLNGGRKFVAVAVTYSNGEQGFDVTPMAEQITCDRCGTDASELGYSERSYGPRDPETGYQDSEVACSACSDDEGRYAAADDAFTAAYEESEP